MSDFTVELRKIQDYPALQNVLATYTLYDESHRTQLNEYLINKYYFRDIGFETPEMFIQRLKTKFMEIMPTMNQLYKSLQLEFDPLGNMNLTAEGTEDSNAKANANTQGTNSTTSTSKSDTVSDQFDMPQTQLDVSGNPSGDYVSSENRSTSTTDGSATSNTDEVRGEDTTGHSATMNRTSGLAGMSPNQLLAEYRANILNVDQMVGMAIAPLFMQIWRPNSRTH